jgi:hypothetical protein
VGKLSEKKVSLSGASDPASRDNRMTLLNKRARGGTL